MKRYSIFIQLFFTTLFLGLVWPLSAIETESVELQNSLVIRSGYADLRTGDIAVRQGKGLISSMFSRLSATDKKYSHAGFVWVKDDECFVIHIEGHKANLHSDIIVEPVQSFISKKAAISYDFYRYDLDESVIKMLDGMFDSLEVTSVMFDDKFDLKTTNQLYCTELIADCLNNAVASPEFIKATDWNDLVYVSIGNIIGCAELIDKSLIK